MINNPIIPIILCGGSGSRLWPLSRESFPKQYLNLSLHPEDKKTLLQKTQHRTRKLKNIKSPILICNEDHRFIVAEQMKEIGIKPTAIILEPCGKNTAPAITIAALKALELEENPHLLIMSSDHEIKDESKFVQIVEEAIKYSSNGRLVTFGIIPRSPETGYGYIQAEKELNPLVPCGEKIIHFLEKPDINTAEILIKDKKYSWNSGIFLFNAKTILDEVQKFNPKILKNCKLSLKKAVIDLDFQRLDKDHFFKCPSISIDVAVMEKTYLGTVLPLDIGWNDIGSWDSVWKTSKKDSHKNFIKGNIISQKNEACYLRSESKLVVAIGLKNIVAVETSDAILIAQKEFSQEVKNVVNKLKEDGISEGRKHKKIYRPWGFFEEIAKDSRWQLKLITVNPNSQLSLQMHHHRAEHWIVVKGTAEVQINNQKTILSENESTFIPLGSKHRLKNPGKIPLKLIEVQSGAYLGEDDIMRFEDKYGRI